MRCMTRNKSEFHYALYSNNTEITDEYGNATGQYQVNYGKPVSALGNISAARGEIQSRQFGESEAYDKVIVLEDIHTPIDEHSILWVDTEPLLTADGTLASNDDGTAKTPHDYVVTRKAVSLNSVSLAIRKVTVT